ncbi:hypothetical protein AeRB84_015890 [Aphanomyces euteiches]|nr:hypothetical protein AeRB84_015890 [Aphanomyces euteiches]
MLHMIETSMHTTDVSRFERPDHIAWAVLIEAGSANGGYKHDVVYNVIAPGYIPKIFASPREYAPCGVKLFYYEYVCDTPRPKANRYFEVVKSLKGRILLDGVGT